MPSNAAQSEALVKRVLRLTRKAYRSADSSGEVLERWLDRQINRKTRTTRTQADAVIPLWETYRDRVKTLEAALADLLNVTMDPTLGWGP